MTGNTLRILTVDKLDGVFNEGVVPLTYTPRRMALHEQYKNFVIVESDYGVLSKSASAAAATNGSKMDEDVEGRQMEESEEDQLPVEQFGLAKAANPEGKWASCIRLLDPFKGETLSLFEMEDNEAAFWYDGVKKWDIFAFILNSSPLQV